MANIAGSYDENAEASADFSPIPTNSYRMKIIESAVEDISKKDNKGRCLKLTWQVETGAYDGRLVWQRINMWAENMGPNTEKVIQIANSQFASIRQATGKIAPQDSSELHHIACEVYVGLSKPQPGYNPQNEVKSVKAAAATSTAQQRQAPASQPQQQRATPARQSPPPQNNSGASAPWRRPAA